MNTKLCKGLPRIDTAGLKSFIPEDVIYTLLQSKAPDKLEVRDILAKSLSKSRLDPNEMAALLLTKDPDLVEEITSSAAALKKEIYGNRIVFFAPLYVGNKCINDCSYCGYRASNASLERKTLSFSELRDEVSMLETKGHKRLILVYGEDPAYNPDFIAATVKEVYSVKVGKGEIRRVNINAAPLDIEGFRRVKAAGIGTYQIFQETYHRASYAKYHPRGLKSDYLWRLYAFDRAMQAGIDDVGMGALIGLYDYRFEALSMLYHVIHLEQEFNVGPHTISFPRMEPALNTELASRPPYAVSDADFMQMIAVIRLSVPYTGMILTAREPESLRTQAIKCGISQIDAGSNIGVGAYAGCDDEHGKRRSQFELSDNRSLDDVVNHLCKQGFLPSFCTGCYRLGRTGEHFMEFAIPGFVKRFCTPNAILTLAEYAADYATPDTKTQCLSAIQRELEQMPAGTRKTELQQKLASITHGQRDLFF